MQGTIKKTSSTKLKTESKNDTKTSQDDKHKKTIQDSRKDENKLRNTIKKEEYKVKKVPDFRKDDPKAKISKTLTKDDRTKILSRESSNISTPRSFLQKSTTADIYGIKNKTASTSKAPKKTNSSYPNNISPMKEFLKASSSTASIKSTINNRKVTQNSTPTRAPPKSFNVTVNSPIAKRKLNLDREKSFVKEVKEVRRKEVVNAEKEMHVDERQRSKTRTLNEAEVKVLVAEGLDNNKEMHNLAKRLSAKPKAFYIDLDEGKGDGKHSNKDIKLSDEEISYEDDFESYESDFDSYHSSLIDDDDDEEEVSKQETKEIRDEENMLDSGNFDLHDRTKAKPQLGLILETAEPDKPCSMTDEGFQEMSSSSVASLKLAHTEVIDRPLFIDFKKSKEYKRKRHFSAYLKQRAKDLLSIITLHEMSYSLFEMKPISYDLYMATFGRNNYTQVAVQTFDDGNTVEVQTEVVDLDNKWTQHPVEFSKNDICYNLETNKIRKNCNDDDFLTKFTFLTKPESKVEENNIANLNDTYKRNPLRIYFEQRDGAGSDKMLEYKTYENRLKSVEYNPQRLKKFLKKVESRISSILYSNTGNTEVSAINPSKFPFSKGYLLISTKIITEDKISFLKDAKITNLCFSETKSNLIMTAHEKIAVLNKYVICMWDISVARREPLKILTAIDNVAVARFRGGTDGIFVAGLEDCSLHLWDLTEEPIWQANVASEEITTNLVENKELTQMEIDREWNLKISKLDTDANRFQCPLQICAYTSSALNLTNVEQTDRIVGLQFIGQASIGQGRKIVGQVMSLQRTGVLTIWSIVQEKSKITPDIGKAYWSKMKLEKSQTISLLNHIDIPIDTKIGETKVVFNLNAAKRRLTHRKQEKSLLKRQNSRPKSAAFDRTLSATSAKNQVLPEEKFVSFSSNWENGVMCNELKVMHWNNGENYLVGKNCGEVLCCRRILGTIKVTTFTVATDTSSVTCIETSPHKLPYFLAATDCGTINLCSLNDARVLLTLDCRNMPVEDIERCQSDHKGRFVSSVTTRGYPDNNDKGTKLPISSIAWSPVNPCSIHSTLLDGTNMTFELTHSDIFAKYSSENTDRWVAGHGNLALLTKDGDVQIHKLSNENKTQEYKNIFEKYVALL